MLEWFYTRRQLPLPRVAQLGGGLVPQPYRRLLVHSSDMTPTLEEFFAERVGLGVITRELHGESYLREVVLHVGDPQRPVLYGVIRILLDHLPPTVRTSVLREQEPLGSILQRECVPHLSWPQSFFRAEPDSHMTRILRLRNSLPLYGRRNVLVDGTRRLLAEVLEVLAPVPRREGADSKLDAFQPGDQASSLPKVLPEEND